MNVVFAALFAAALALARAAAAESAQDILGPAMPLQTESSFSGNMLDAESEVLTPAGIMDQAMFDAQYVPPAAVNLPDIAPAAGPLAEGPLSPAATPVSATGPAPALPPVVQPPAPYPGLNSPTAPQPPVTLTPMAMPPS